MKTTIPGNEEHSQDLLADIYDLKNQANNIKLKIIDLQDEQDCIEHKISALQNDWRQAVMEKSWEAC